MALPFIVPFALGFASGFLASRHGQALRETAKPLADRVGRSTLAALERGRTLYWAEREKLEDRVAEWREADAERSAPPASPDTSSPTADAALDASCPVSEPAGHDRAT